MAEVDGRVVGFGNVGRHQVDTDDGGVAFTNDGELYGFYLHPDSRGSGVADALIVACRNELASRFGVVHLWVLRDNPRARRFYEPNGWSCGDGDDMEIAWWEGPQMPGMPTAPDPVAEIRYSLDPR